MKNLRYQLSVIVFSLSGAFFSNAFGHSEKLMVVASKKSEVSHLYFHSTLNPLHSTPLISPANGRIIARHFFYGQHVEAGEVLLNIDAEDLANTYRQCLSDYLQKKSQWQNQKARLEGDKALFKAGVISQQEMDESRNHYATALMSLTQAQFELEKRLKQTRIKTDLIEKLNLEDIDQVAKALQTNFSQFAIPAPTAGVVLMPDVSEKHEEDTIHWQVGDNLKAGQTIVSLADLSGFSLHIQVSEFNILQIKTGAAVTVTGDAFPDIVLQGVVSQVAIQANTATSDGQDIGGTSMYRVDIIIPKISSAQQKQLRVGMTAKVDMTIQQTANIMIPFDAVTVKNGQATVEVLDKKTQQWQKRIVEIGRTTTDSVSVISGLAVGDEILRHRKGD